MHMASVLASRAIAAGVVFAFASGTALAHDMIEVGLTSSKKQLAAHFDIAAAIPIEESIFDGIPGFAGPVLGFESLLFDDEIEQVFKLPSDCDIRVRVMSFDPGVRLWNDHSTAPLEVGEAFSPGVPYFHTHPIWQITEPGFDKNYNITLALEDATGNYGTSEPFTVTFTPVPTPGAAGLLGVAGLAGLRRRR